MAAALPGDGADPPDPKRQRVVQKLTGAAAAQVQPAVPRALSRTARAAARAATATRAATAATAAAAGGAVPAGAAKLDTDAAEVLLRAGLNLRLLRRLKETMRSAVR